MNTSSYPLASSRSLSLVFALVVLGLCAVAAPIRHVADHANAPTPAYGDAVGSDHAGTTVSPYGDVAREPASAAAIPPYGVMRHDVKAAPAMIAPYGAYAHVADAPAAAILPYGTFRARLAP